MYTLIGHKKSSENCNGDFIFENGQNKENLVSLFSKLLENNMTLRYGEHAWKIIVLEDGKTILNVSLNYCSNKYDFFGDLSSGETNYELFDDAMALAINCKKLSDERKLKEKEKRDAESKENEIKMLKKKLEFLEGTKQ